MEIRQLRKKLTEFVEERDWQKFHTPKDLALAISIESGELSELFLWKTLEESRVKLADDIFFHAILDEISDIMIYCLNMTNACESLSGKKIDIGEAITKKIEKNANKYPVALYKSKARLEKPE